MSKKEVLEDIYPEELDYIYQKKKEKELNKYEGYRHQLLSVMAGSGAKTESGDSLFSLYMKELNDKIDILENKDKPVVNKHYTPETIDKELDKLRGLQGVINQNKQRKRR